MFRFYRLRSPEYLVMLLAMLSNSVCISRAMASAPPSTSASPWPQFGIDSAGTRQSDFVGPTSQPELKWTFLTGPPANPGLTRNLVYASPTLGNDHTVYAPSYDGYIHAVNSDGSRLWSYSVGAALRASATVASDGSIYHLSPQGLLKLNKDGVSQFQKSELVNNDPSVTLADDGRLYVGNEDELVALDANGSTLWTLEVGGQIEGTPVIGNEGTVYFGSQNGVLNAVSDQGESLWTFPIPGRNVKSATIGSDGTIYAGGQSGDFFAINPNGTQKWHFAGANDIFTAAAIGDDNTVVFAATNAIFALDSNGDERWRYSDQSFGHGSVVIDADGNVFATRNNRVIGLNSLGELLWEFSLDSNYVYSSITLDSAGVLYFGGDDGLYAIAAVAIPEPRSGMIMMVLCGVIACQIAIRSQRAQCSDPSL